ncbi:hypothetical protein FAI41_04265 [Acetobacteraceae bacterium]|nr:hypothetical protein FAI41_04265 [Acetobacteraceae bacterium]
MAIFRAGKKLGSETEQNPMTEILFALQQLSEKRLILADKSYHLAQKEEKRNAIRFENDLVKLRWASWSNYVRRIFFILEAVNGLDEEKLEEANRLIETILVTDKLKWTFEDAEVHKEADFILSLAAKLSLDEHDLDNLPETTANIRKSLNKIDKKIVPLMRIQTGF